MPNNLPVSSANHLPADSLNDSDHLSNTLSITLVYPIIKTIMQKGLPIEPFFQAVGFEQQRLQNADERISSQELEELIEAAVSYTGDSYFGLSQGLMMEFTDMGIVGYVISHSKTVGEALAAYERYYKLLLNCVPIALLIEKDELTVRFIPNTDLHLSKHCIDEMVVGLLRLIKRLTLKPIPLKQISFTYEQPPELKPYMAALDMVPSFQQAYTQLVLNKEVLGYNVLYADQNMLRMFEDLAQQTLQQLLQGKQFTDKIVEWIYNCMPSYFPTLKQTAEAFFMSERRLQQKLAEEGQSFIQLGNKVKKELAISLLKREDCSISEIAYILHFSEQSAFQNAFKRWTGVTPGQYRRNS